MDKEYKMSAPDKILGKRKTASIIIAGTVGNALEWFDLFTYAFLAVTISKVFFPVADATDSLLVTFGVFAGSYLLRPVGALVLGNYADRRGRKAGMTVTIWLMGVGTAVMAFTPSYETIGMAAPVIIVLGRCIQSFSAGGEFGSSIAFLVESAPRKHRTLFGSGEFVGIGLATGTASLFGMYLHWAFTPTQIVDWAWRIPFIFGLLIVPFGVWIRHYVEETPEFLARENKKVIKRAPALDVFKSSDIWLVLLAIGVYSMSGSGNYLLHEYMPTYAKVQIGILPTVAFAGALCFSLVQIFGTPLVGLLCDKWGKLRFIITGILLLGISVYPAFHLIITYPYTPVYIGTIIFMAILVTIATGPIPTFLSEEFRSETRTTCLGLVHNVTFTVFGGLAPVISIVLIKITGSKYAPSLYVIATVVLAICCASIFVKRVMARQKGRSIPVVTSFAENKTA